MDLSRWTFATEDRAEQQQQFDYWKGWFGYEDSDEPERIEGNVWYARRK